ncbi:MAG TPA: response regulator [Bryobacteraceae bacterium]|jgi:CheY-like chemotaxis protein|nr:response regulator [Bryobacteraceae bacterium]
MLGRVLLADDSPHAQRMGERILREEGFELLTATDGEEAFAQLASGMPDVILADAYLPGTSGFELCRAVKSNEALRHTRVVLTAGMLEPFDEEEARRAGCDGILKKPFEASVVVEMIKALVEAARYSRGLFGADVKDEQPPLLPAEEKIVRVVDPAHLKPDPERVRAAITLALDAALPAMIEEITERVLVALGH